MPNARANRQSLTTVAVQRAEPLCRAHQLRAPGSSEYFQAGSGCRGKFNRAHKLQWRLNPRHSGCCFTAHAALNSIDVATPYEAVVHSVGAQDEQLLSFT